MRSFGAAASQASAPDNLSCIDLPDGLAVIKASTFSSCVNLTSIKLPQQLTKLELYALDRTGLKSITIPNSVIEIGPCAFEECRNLKTITIPEKVTFLGTNAFHSCTGLTEAIVLPKTPPVCENNGAFYNTSECPIYVPKASVDSYKKAEYWKDWAHRIKAIP